MCPETKIIIAIGSNWSQQENISFAKKKLKLLLGDSVRFTTEKRTTAIGIEAEPFTNCICTALTKHTMQQLEKAFKHIEKQCFRTKKNNRLNRITLDIDILQYGNERYHENDWEREYIKVLMKEIENENDNIIIEPINN